MTKTQFVNFNEQVADYLTVVVSTSPSMAEAALRLKKQLAEESLAAERGDPIEGLELEPAPMPRGPREEHHVPPRS